MNMIERVAASQAEFDARPLISMPRVERERYFARARAAIEAMREPTKAMVEPGYDAIDTAIDFWNYDSGSGYCVDPIGGVSVWKAMIDAALSEPCQTSTTDAT